MTSPAVDTHDASQVDAEAVADAVRACSHVADLSGGSFGEVATYLPGKRVAGVRTTEDAVQIHVVAHYGPTVAEVAGQVRAAAAGRTGGRRVDVTIEDLQLEQPAESGPAESTKVEQRSASGEQATVVRASTTVVRPGPMSPPVPGVAPGSHTDPAEPAPNLARPSRVTMPPADPGLV